MKLSLLFLLTVIVAGCTAPIKERWLRGNTHTHSLWSDGNDFPEMIVGWYKEQGYDFVAISDHNILAVDDIWMALDTITDRQEKPGPSALEKYKARYDDTWIETRDREGKTEIRLKRIDKYRTLFEEPGKFLVIQAEEISSQSKDKPVHINAVNLPGNQIIPAVISDASVEDVMRENLRAVMEREKETGQSILAHLNHPNFKWAITAEELAHVVEEQFFEVYNGHPEINHLGKEDTPGDELIWDIANTIRLAELDAEPLFGIATDDSHNYHGGEKSPGRGWIMVRTSQLEGNAIVDAMRAGDFYSSTGVFLKEIDYDADKRILSVEIDSENGVQYSTQLIGTRKGYKSLDMNSQDLGEVFAEKSGTNVSFEIPSDALYARATITSTRQHPNPSFENHVEQAWVQPVGWR